MRPLVNRERELALLREQRDSAPSLVVVRGRRRIGKTFLLAHAFPGERVISYQADEQPRSVQLAAFAAEAARLLPGAPPLSFDSWDGALDFLGSQADERPLVVIIDELQYACLSEPALPSIIQRHWDGWDRRGTHICLVLSGSALSFMEGLLSQDAPLHGRATYRPTIEPLDYRDARELAPARSSPEQLIERYAVIGGTPQYQVWAGHRSLEQVVREGILRTGAPLHEEPLTLVREEHGIRDPRRYFGVLSAIASGRTRNAQIGSLLELPSSNVAVVLERLASLGYIEERTPVAPGARRRRGFWRLRDPFFNFWFRRVQPNRSRLDREEAIEAVWEQIAADLDTYVGRIFEDLCRSWLDATRRSRRPAPRPRSDRGGHVTDATRSISPAPISASTRCSDRASGHDDRLTRTRCKGCSQAATRSSRAWRTSNWRCSLVAASHGACSDTPRARTCSW